MDQDQSYRETLIIDLNAIDLGRLPALPASALEISLRHILDEQHSQPESYLGFQSAICDDD